MHFFFWHTIIIWLDIHRSIILLRFYVTYLSIVKPCLSNAFKFYFLYVFFFSSEFTTLLQQFLNNLNKCYSCLNITCFMYLLPKRIKNERDSILLPIENKYKLITTKIKDGSLVITTHNRDEIIFVFLHRYLILNTCYGMLELVKSLHFSII